MMMKKACGAILAAALVLGSIASAQDSEGWIELFNGKDFTGWTHLNGTASYVVKDGMIVGTTSPGSWNSFLCTYQKFGDFELEFDVKCDEGLNSGVQIRSRLKCAEDAVPGDKSPNNMEGRVFGPQVEIETSPGQAGYIYAEATSLGWLSEEPQSKDKAVNEHGIYKNGEWNHYRIVAKGPHIQTWINGQKVGDINHEGIYATHPKGFLGLQVHRIADGHAPMSVAWKNIRIKPLD